MKKICLLMALLLTGCGATVQEGTTMKYQKITAEEAKKMMEQQKCELLLDVREQDEYEAGHIPGAVLLPVGMIDKDAAAGTIPATDTTILVYCRSGKRSQKAAATLAELGYTQVYDIGGIHDWQYEIEKGL